jgi:hypothetical protein
MSEKTEGSTRSGKKRAAIKYVYLDKFNRSQKDFSIGLAIMQNQITANSRTLTAQKDMIKRSKKLIIIGGVINALILIAILTMS